MPIKRASATLTPVRGAPPSDSEIPHGCLESLIQRGHFADVTDLVLLFDDPTTPDLHDHQAYATYGESGDPALRPHRQALEDTVNLCKALGEQLRTVTIRLYLPELTFPLIPPFCICICQHCAKLEKIEIEDTMCGVFEDPSDDEKVVCFLCLLPYCGSFTNPRFLCCSSSKVSASLRTRESPTLIVPAVPRRLGLMLSSRSRSGPLNNGPSASRVNQEYVTTPFRYSVSPTYDPRG